MPRPCRCCTPGPGPALQVLLPRVYYYPPAAVAVADDSATCRPERGLGVGTEGSAEPQGGVVDTRAGLHRPGCLRLVTRWRCNAGGCVPLVS